MLVFSSLLFIFQSFEIWTVKLVGSALLAAACANILLKMAAHFVPTGIVKNTSGKAVFITGCDSGFGWLLAQKLDHIGFHVFAGCLQPAQEGALELQRLCSKRLEIIDLDVTNNNSVVSAAELVRTTLDGKELWAVVNNAGIGFSSEIEFCTIEQFQQIHDVNAMGAVRVTKAFLPLLRKSRGRVVIVASFAGRNTVFGICAYSMSKHAAVSFADGLRQEMGKFGVTVHTIEPYFYMTRIVDRERARLVAQSNWNNASPETHKDYGDEYFQAYLKTFDRVEHVSRTNLDEVVSDMVDAVAAIQPKARYIPYYITELWVRIGLSLPQIILDGLGWLGMPMVKPRQAQECKCA